MDYERGRFYFVLSESNEEYSNQLSHYSRDAKKNDKIFICTKPNPMDDE